jgi:hypothetical protein
MKLLVAARGDRPDDFTRTVRGELVRIVGLCDRGRFGDQRCGCRRGFAGLATGRCTSLAQIAELDITAGQYAALLGDALTREGKALAPARVARLAAELAGLAAEFDVGARVRRDLDDVNAEP